MPSKNNPNKASRSGRRIKVRSSITASIRGTGPTGPKVDSKGFIRSAGSISKKKERKKLRNVQYAKAREQEQQELQRLLEAGEIEMKDTVLEPLSKTQRKKLERLEAAAAAVGSGASEGREARTETRGEDADEDMVVE